MSRQSEKNLLNSHTSSRCPDNMVNFGLLTAEICCRVWVTPANFNGFRVLACSVTAQHSISVRQPNFAAWNRGRHLYSAGRPSRWSLAHMLIMATLRIADADIQFLPCGFFPSILLSRLISAAADWMSTIHRHMVWP